MTPKPKQTSSYSHPEAESLMRPEVGTQAQFRKKKPAKRYRYDSSLAPELTWDGQNGARELGEWLLGVISKYAQGDDASFHEFKNSRGGTIYSIHSLQEAVDLLKRISKPFLNWSGKAERLSFDVPTLPLFVHERLSTQAILETLKGHKRDKQLSLFDLFADPQHSVADQVLRAYEYKDGWTNRMILGDSLVVMNSLLQFESLGGQVQMIYIDPPYGINFGSNFQPFVKKREVSISDDNDLTREPEMVKAYRDTWELGLHSYLTYLRDRFLLSRDLLCTSGSIFVQISDRNLHHVREILDEVFGEENFVSIIPFRKKTMPLGAKYLEQMYDFILWYAKQKEDPQSRKIVKYNKMFLKQEPTPDNDWSWYELPDGSRHKMSPEQVANAQPLPANARIYRLKSLEPSGTNPSGQFSFEFEGKVYRSPKRGWATDPEGMKILESKRRLQPKGEYLNYTLFFDDYPVTALTTPWTNTVGPQDRQYVVETNDEVISRCLLMTSDPGDLVLDLTCGRGTTAYSAEQWGRRWITTDVSRVPLALARQRLLTATFRYYVLQDEKRGPTGGFIYKSAGESHNPKSIGPGIVPHITLGSIANNEGKAEEVLIDRPEIDTKYTRVTGPFVVEATIPTPVNIDGTEAGFSEEINDTTEAYASFMERMIEILRRSPVLLLGGNKSISLKGVRPPAKSLSLSAEAMVDSGQTSVPVAIVFGPENGAVSEKLVYEAAREAHAKNYHKLYVIGFAIEAKARQLVESCEGVTGISATYIQATPDLLMGDLLKNMRSSQIFSVCGLPEIALRSREKDGEMVYEVELLGLDVFDPITMENEHRGGNDVPAWFLDTEYNGLVFHVSQAFFPRTSAWDSLKRALKGEYEDSVWEHLAGSVSAPFEADERGQIAVKVIDDRGNELLVVKSISEAMDA